MSQDLEIKHLLETDHLLSYRLPHQVPRGASTRNVSILRALADLAAFSSIRSHLSSSLLSLGPSGSPSTESALPTSHPQRTSRCYVAISLELTRLSLSQLASRLADHGHRTLHQPSSSHAPAWEILAHSVRLLSTTRSDEPFR